LHIMRWVKPTPYVMRALARSKIHARLAMLINVAWYGYCRMQ